MSACCYHEASSGVDQRPIAIDKCWFLIDKIMKYIRNRLTLLLSCFSLIFGQGWFTYSKHICPVIVAIAHYDVWSEPASITLMMTGFYLAMFIFIFAYVFFNGFGSITLLVCSNPGYTIAGYSPEVMMILTVAVLYKLVQIVSKAASMRVMIIAAVMDVLVIYLLIHSSTRRP